MSDLALRLIAENRRTRATFLDLGNCGLTEVPGEVGELVWLKSLSLTRNENLTDLAPLAGLSALRTLDLRKTQVTDLAPLAGLLALGRLLIPETKVTNLAPLAGLSALVFVDASGTQVTDLSPLVDLIRRGFRAKLSSDTWHGHGIYVQDCPLTNPPPEIVKQGNEAILNYFAERKVAGVDYLYEAKMLILGEGGAGKTSLLRRLYQPGQPLPAESDTTRGIAIYRHEFKLS